VGELVANGPVTRYLDLSFDTLVVEGAHICPSSVRSGDLREGLATLLETRLDISCVNSGSLDPVRNYIAEAVTESIALATSQNASGRVK